MDILDEQVAYYRARAGEYDEWWQRVGRYDRGEADRLAWRADIASAESMLAAFAPRGHVLELAAGTGNWTRVLRDHDVEVTALDASRETLAVNAAKLGHDPRVEYVAADLYRWSPPREYDVVFFSFFLTHVPDAMLDVFWSVVDRCLSPAGRVFLVDSAHPSHARAGRDPAPDSTWPITTVDDLDASTATRTLTDGRAFRIVKRFWQPDELVVDAGARGWSLRASNTDRFFLVAHGQRLDEEVPLSAS